MCRKLLVFSLLLILFLPMFLVDKPVTVGSSKVVSGDYGTNSMIVINQTEYTWYGDFIVNAPDTVVVENCNFIVENGMIYVYGTMEITNSTVGMRHVSSIRKYIYVYGNFTMSNSTVLGDNTVRCYDSVLILDSFSPTTALVMYGGNSCVNSSSIYHIGGSGGECLFVNSNSCWAFLRRITLISLNSTINTADITALMLVEGNFTFPGGLIEYLTIYNSTLINSYVSKWDIVVQNLNVTISNSVIGWLDFTVDPAWSGNITLHSGYIEYLELDYLSQNSHVIIVNSTVDEFCFSVHSDSVVQISNSNIGFVTFGHAGEFSILNSNVSAIGLEDFQGTLLITNTTVNECGFLYIEGSLDLTLKEGFHEFYNLRYGFNITLVDSSVNHWYILTNFPNGAVVNLHDSTLSVDLHGEIPWNLALFYDSPFCSVCNSSLESIICLGSGHLVLTNCTVATLYVYDNSNVTAINSTIGTLITDPVSVELTNSQISAELDFLFQIIGDFPVTSLFSEEYYPPLPESVQPFSQYVNITMPYNDYFEAQLKIYYNETKIEKAHANETLLQMYYLDELGVWQLYPIQGVNTVENYVWANVTHFSCFVMGKIAPFMIRGPYYTWWGAEYQIVKFEDRRPIRLISPY